jgi:uncharacterized membrane protein
LPSFANYDAESETAWILLIEMARLARVLVRAGGKSMAEMEKSIEVNAPLGQVYNQWTQFEEFPRFMEGVVEVRQIDDKRLFWRANIAGVDRSWEAEIVDQTPEQRIAWRATSGVENGGAVLFKPLPGGRTEVTMRMRYEPEGVTETIGDALGFVGRRVQGDLERFAKFMEERGEATGAWRGEIHGKQVLGG